MTLMPDPPDAATVCHYCGTPLVDRFYEHVRGEDGSLRPHGLRRCREAMRLGMSDERARIDADRARLAEQGETIAALEAQVAALHSILSDYTRRPCTTALDGDDLRQWLADWEALEMTVQRALADTAHAATQHDQHIAAQARAEQRREDVAAMRLTVDYLSEQCDQGPKNRCVNDTKRTTPYCIWCRAASVVNDSADQIAGPDAAQCPE